MFQYSSSTSEWNIVLGGVRILGNTSYSNTLLTTTIDSSATALYEIGPVTCNADSKLLIVANLSLFTGATTIQMTVGRHTISGGTSGSSINVPSGTSEIIMPFTTGPSYFMASATTVASGEAVNLNGTATDIPGSGTFYYRIWASSSASNVANSTLTANLTVLQM